MQMTIDRCPPPAAPVACGGDDPRGPLLRLRLGDGQTWAHEFDATSAAALQEGCLEAFVACRLEWDRRAAELPAHQTMKRLAVVASRPRSLALHVLDPATGHWLDANRAADPMRTLVIREPGTATGCWSDADWTGAWLRCLKTWWSAAELARFLGVTMPKLLGDELGGEAA